MATVTKVMAKPVAPKIEKIVVELSVMEAAHLNAFLQSADVGGNAPHVFKSVYRPLYEILLEQSRIESSDVYFGAQYPTLTKLL